MVFDTKGYAIPDSEFAPKMLGYNNSGDIIFGYARNPNVDFTPALISARRPTYDPQQKYLHVEIQNFGLSISNKLEVKIYGDSDNFLSRGVVEPLKPYEKYTLLMSATNIEEESYEVVIYDGETELSHTRFSAK